MKENLVLLPKLYTAGVTFKDGSVRMCAMRVFLCKQYSGEVRGTKNEIPEWISLAKIGTLHLLPNVEEAIQEGLKSM